MVIFFEGNINGDLDIYTW